MFFFMWKCESILIYWRASRAYFKADYGFHNMELPIMKRKLTNSKTMLNQKHTKKKDIANTNQKIEDRLGISNEREMKSVEIKIANGILMRVKSETVCRVVICLLLSLSWSWLFVHANILLGSNCDGNGNRFVNVIQWPTQKVSILRLFRRY